MRAGCIEEMVARQAMTAKVEFVRPSETIRTALYKMVDLDLTALPVLDNKGACIGLITKTDILKRIGALDELKRADASNDLAALYFGVSVDELTDSLVKEAMTTYVLSAGPEDSLMGVARKMLRYDIHHLPVCDESKRPIGMVSTMDLVKAMLVDADPAATLCYPVATDSNGSRRAR